MIEGTAAAGKVALVTGGSRGIGAAICRRLAAVGVDVAANYNNDRRAAEALVAEITERGGRAIAVGADVSDPAEARGLVEQVATQLGTIELLVNNAGIWEPGAIDRLSDERWQRTLGVNLSAAMYVTGACVPAMKQRGRGRIVNISSTAGQRGEAGYAHYAASKSGLIGLTKSLAAELAADGILTNCVAPGWVETDMTRHVLESERGEELLGAIPLGRMGRPEEVAAAVAFLCSNEASYINGEVINVNGGSVLCG